MEWLFGHKKTPAELLKENQRMLKKAIRELDRERSALERAETKIIADIKKSAKAGQMEAAKIMAKDLVRTRASVRKFIMMKTQIQAVSHKIQTLKSTNSMAQAMKGVTKAMKQMNSKMNLPEIHKLMMEFEKQNDQMEATQEAMDDTMDSVMGVDGEEEETEEIVSHVMTELGLSLDGQLPSAPSAGAVKVSEPESVSADDDLLARLNNLKK